MGGAGMSAASYRWLIVGEGDFDVTTYTTLLRQFDVSNFLVKSVGGKNKVFRMNKWEELPIGNDKIVSQKTLENDQGRKGFKGVIFIVDSDENENLEQNYTGYSENCRSRSVDYADWQPPCRVKANVPIMRLDTLKGVDSEELPIYGVCVPVAGKGCLETDLLQAYGYPVEERDYDRFAETIRSASQSWGVARSGNGKAWWDSSRNGKARMDKFMYAALKEGFEVNNLKIKLIPEPQIIKAIKDVMNLVL
jgi:hypothetical protein